MQICLWYVINPFQVQTPTCLILSGSCNPEHHFPFPLSFQGQLLNQTSRNCSHNQAAAAKSLQSCPTLCDPIDGSPSGSPSLGFSRQEHWSGLPFPCPMHESQKWKWSHSAVSDSLRPHGLQPTRLLRPWDFPGKSTGVGCHCLLRFCSWVVSKT